MKQLLGTMLLLSVLFGRMELLDTQVQQATVEFRNPRVESNYPDGITFRIEICGGQAYPSTDFDYTLNQHLAPYSEWIDAGLTFYDGQTPDGCHKQRLDLDTKQLEMPPFTLIHYYWSFGAAEARVSTSPIYAFYYTDPTYAWKTLANKELIVRWHDRPDSFGQQVMSIASTAYQHQSQLYGGQLEGPITIIIANTDEEFAAWRPENDFAGGIAVAESYLTVQVVEAELNYENWLYDVIPHELSHIFFGNMLEKNRSLPLWLNEGFATYLEYSDHWSEWGSIHEAYDADSVWALNELDPHFKAEQPDVYYAYAQGYYAILYMYEVYGEQAVSYLLSGLSAGQTVDVAFTAAFGVGLDQFDTDYMTWLETRIAAPPPSTALPTQTTDLDIAKQLGYSLIMIVCFAPIFFVGFGALGLGFLWVLNDLFSVKEKRI